MIFNFSKTKQFTTRITMENEVLPVENKTKLLGTVITNDLKWDENTSFLVKKANKRLLLLRKATEYTNSMKNLKAIYLSHIRSIVDQSCVIWHNNLTEENISDIERIQKNACRIILGNRYTNYSESLKKLNLDTLHHRREKLSLKFATNCIENPKTKKLFPLRKKKHKFKTRKAEKYKVLFAKTKRLADSTVPYLQRLLNKENLNKENSNKLKI